MYGGELLVYRGVLYPMDGTEYPELWRDRDVIEELNDDRWSSELCLEFLSLLWREIQAVRKWLDTLVEKKVVGVMPCELGDMYTCAKNCWDSTLSIRKNKNITEQPLSLKFRKSSVDLLGSVLLLNATFEDYRDTAMEWLESVRGSELEKVCLAEFNRLEAFSRRKYNEKMKPEVYLPHRSTK